MHRTLILILVLFVIGLCGVDARACQCAGEGAPCQQYWEASAVFIGTVIEGRLVNVKRTEYEYQQRAVRISIDEAFRGVEGAEVEVMTGLGDSDCGFAFRRTQQYLVYAFRSEEDQKLHTSICVRTRAISEADADLIYIRGLSKAKPGGTIRGEVIRERRNETGGSDGQPLAGVKVTIDGPQKAETLSDAKGEFKIEGLKPGEYTVAPAAPKGLATRDIKKVTLVDRGCAVTYIWLESNARIGGRVTSPEGLPVKNAALSLVDADKPRFTGHTDYAYADEDGGYSFKLIPPGRYVILLRYDGMLTSQHRPFPVIYYPGVADKSQARIFTIAEGVTIDLDIKVPPLPTESEIRGQVVWPDGKPATTANVGYMLPNDSVFYGIKVDEEGRFSFIAYNGLTLGVGASVEVTKGKYASGNSGPIVVGVSTEPIKLVLQLPKE